MAEELFRPEFWRALSWLTFASNRELVTDKELIEFLVATEAI